MSLRRTARDWTQMWNLAAPVGCLEILPAAALTTRHLRASLAAGDRTHAARALAQEACFASIQELNNRAAASRLFARARTLYEAKQNPALESWTLFTEGSAAGVQGDYVSARTKLEQAEALLCARCPDEPWLLTNVRCSLVTAWWQQGELGRHTALVEQWLASAAERKDRFALAALESWGGAFRFLLRDDATATVDRVVAVMAPWPREPVAFIHLGEASMLYWAALYQGGEAALRYLEGERARHDRAFLFKTGFGREMRAAWWGPAALTAYVSASPTSRAQKDHLAVARRIASVARRSKSPQIRTAAFTLEAQLAVFAGDMEKALELTRAAVLDAERRGYGLVETPLRYLEGLIEGGDAGRDTRERALALCASQGFQNPRRFVSTNCAAVDFLEVKSR